MEQGRGDSLKDYRKGPGRLKPEYKLLGVGCSTPRGGVHFTRLLNDRDRYGIDQDEQLLDEGRRIDLLRFGLPSKPVRLA